MYAMISDFRDSTSKNLQMEATGEANIGSLLDKINPPLLEDVGLEDCALHPDSIQEAFLKAATAFRSHIFHDSDDESEGDCINIGSGTIETQIVMANLVVGNLEAHFSNNPLLTPVV
uniref:Uncharacterized protein n=1 Tax=Lactuca sativa TaxID=4236 RepID=A0A9R1VIG1_LACSA|nr:hypothetical protein LSAT_V11C500276620 [Lactuca sativa]